MRILSVRLIVSLVLGITLVSVLSSYCEVQVEEHGLRRDLERRAAVLREGFGLTVTESLWKGKPTIASAVGGIPIQIIHKLTGVLVYSSEGCAYQIRYLLTHPEFARQVGQNGREHVKENFLMTTNLKRWLLLLRILLEAPGK